jgi:tRNA nucleotidyltransferase/poly(A) polymerase
VERGVGRALVPWEGGQMVVDVAQFRGPDLLADLRLRDFTINALAMPVRGERNRVIDPLGGMADLERKVLRRCGPESIASDPVRGLRAVRASVQYGLRIEPETQADMRAHARQLAETSPERVRDEFFQMLGSAKPARRWQRRRGWGCSHRLFRSWTRCRHRADRTAPVRRLAAHLADSRAIGRLAAHCWAAS